MSYSSASVNSMVNYFNNLIAQQMMTQNFYKSVQTQTAGSPDEATTAQKSSQEISQELSDALTGLAALIGGGNTSSNSALTSSMTYSIGDLISKGADAGKLTDLVNSMINSNDGDDLLYTRTGSNDPWITLENRNPVSGADVQNLLYQAGNLANRGKDVNSYLDMAQDVFEKGDYDDVRRLISVTNTINYADQDLSKFYDFGKEILDKRHYDYESNIFSVQTLVGYGANLDTALKIMRNMENTGLDGRNNMVDLNRVTIDARNKGAYLPYVFDQMAASGDTREFMNQYMTANGMKTTAPDFNRFDRIERIDGEDMEITEGESAALFSQAISNVHGLLDKSVMFWSSVQTGAISNGDNYLDLSKLAAGTYDIYVKIGNYAGGTDTAKKRVIVKAKDEEVLVDGGSGIPEIPEIPEEPEIPEVIPPTQTTINKDGKIKVEVKKGDASLSSDLYMVHNGETILVAKDANKTGVNTVLERDFKEGDEVSFFIRTNAKSMGLGTYDHGNDEVSPSGKPYATKTDISENEWKLGFEDLPEGKADFDYNDVVVNVTLIPNQVPNNIVAPSQPENKKEDVSAPVENKSSVAPIKEEVKPQELKTTEKVQNSAPVENKAVEDVKPNSVESTKELDDEYPEMSDIDKMIRLYNLSADKISAKDAYDFIDEKVGKGNVVKFLNDIGQSSMAKKYEDRSLSWMDFVLGMAKDPKFYQKASAEFRRNISEEEASKFFKSHNFNNKDKNEALWLLGYKNNKVVKQDLVKNDEIEKAKNCEPKNSDKVEKAPVIDNKKEEVKETVPVTQTTIQEAGKIKVEVKKGDASLSSDLYMVHNGETILVAKDANKTGVNTVLERDFNEGDEVSFFIRTNANSWGLGTYDHGNDEVSPSGKAYAEKNINSSTSWSIGFEDLPEGKADFDYDDVVLNVTLLPAEKKESSKVEENISDIKNNYRKDNFDLPVDNSSKKEDKKVENNRTTIEKKDDDNKGVNENSLTEKYKKKNDEYKSLLDSMTKNSENYRKQLEAERSRIRKKDLDKSSSSKNDNKVFEQRYESDTNKVKPNNEFYNNNDIKPQDNNYNNSERR